MKCFFFILFPLYSISQTIPNSSSLKLEEIMKGNEFVGFLPENVRWSIDGQTIYFDWNPNHELGNSTYAYRINEKGATAKKVERTEAIEFDPTQSHFPQQYASIDGALVVIDKRTSVVTPIYYTSEDVYNVQRTNTEHIVAFQQGNNLFLYNALNGSIAQITNFHSGSAKNDKKDSTFLMKEEQFLFEYIRDKNERTEWNNEQRKSRFSLPEPIYFKSTNPVDMSLHAFAPTQKNAILKWQIIFPLMVILIPHLLVRR
jgi:hypothetical protein